ncbi:methyltransferase family protein [Candidatus Contubernalis alkaliaceticus]|uniref:methyltransferase family protein n=1 Tax=Candidatus Contubernalis alkaliaceticus TaxID=338645 RepID=UPI001F4C2880|nr:isoprenylcysteine carboxylmethyltransferase family protein [Candidatus Contubernalis alkalaceticus]UNC92201.1 isoprenylcysteine carboxylmethyltransferase family protein [Candidatus Contubernalis alkalaceticus]
MKLNRVEGIQKWWFKNIAYLIITWAALFLSSGRIDWLMAWVYLSSIFILIIANALVMDQKLLVERSRLQEGTKKWDIALASIVAIWGPLLIWITSGLDIRFGWTQGLLPGLQIVSMIFVLLGGLTVTWSMEANKFFSATVRIQSDRNHTVVTRGPYMYVRHPGYLGGIIHTIMTPVALGSWAALLPGLFIVGIFIVRTGLEDKVLQRELDGYRDYSRTVRYRLIPGIW